MNSFYEQNRLKIIRFLFVTGFIAFIYLFVNYLFGYMVPFVFGYLLSLLMEPLARLFTVKFRMKRGIAAALCVILFLLIIGMSSISIFSRIFREGRSFVGNIHIYIDDITRSFAQLRVTFNDVFSLIPLELQDSFSAVLDTMIASVTSSLGSGVSSGTSNVVTLIPGLFMGMLLSVISLFFFIKDKDLIADFLTTKSPAWLSANLQSVKKGLFNALGGYLKAQAILMSVTCVICMTGLVIMRYPYALFVGLAIAFIDALPIFGSGFILWPWAFFSFISGNLPYGIGLLVIYAVVMVTRQSLEPRVLGKQIGIHPLITLMAIYIGLKVFGGLGFIIGPVTIVIVKALIEAETLTDGRDFR